MIDGEISPSPDWPRPMSEPNHPPAGPTRGPNTFEARTQAARIAESLNQAFVSALDNRESNPLGHDFILQTTDEKRLFTLGHWTFSFVTLLDDKRGQPPLVWLMLQIAHKEAADAEPVAIATFSNFAGSGCDAVVYDPNRRRDVALRFDYEDFSHDILAASAAGYIRQYLEADPPVADRLKDSFLRRFIRTGDFSTTGRHSAQSG
jgi:hypothetical protein